MNDDLKWFLSTCHQCQTRSHEKVVLPPTVSIPAGLFSKMHADTMHLPRSSNGMKYLVQGRCSLIGWPEFRTLRKENGKALGRFLMEEVMCRWGAIAEIVTDNGSPWVAALDWLADKYHIHHIRISAYNSQSNGLIETAHQHIRESLVKICNGDMRNWDEHAHYVFWADRITTRKATGMSPFQAATGSEPLLPFDITEATFLFPAFTSKLSDTDLLTNRAIQLERRDEDLAKIHDRVVHARYQSIADFEKRHRNTIHDYDFTPGELVLVLNKKIEKDVSRKC